MMHHKKWLSVLFLVFIKLAMFVANTPASEWTIETVEATSSKWIFTNVSPRAIAVDAYGHPHIAYGGDCLYYAYYDGSNWRYETVDSSIYEEYDETEEDVQQQCISLALDNSGKAHISYFQYRDYSSYYHHNRTLMYATNVSGLWVTSTVDSMDNKSGRDYASIALDSSGKVHIGYSGKAPIDYQNEHTDLRYATNTTGTWTTETVNSNVAEDISIAIDTSGKVHISYHPYPYHAGRMSDYVLKYATNASGSWVTETVDSDNSLYPSIALDTSGKVHISYYDVDTVEIKYATNASGSWVTTTVDGSMSEGMYTSIALDSSERVHISYLSNYYQLMYATNSSGSWVTETVNSSEDAKLEYTSIAVDKSGKAHISYYYYNIADVGRYNLKYVTNTTGSWITTTVDRKGNVGEYASLAVDKSGKAHLSYYNAIDGDLKYATNASGGWTTETVDSEGDVGQSTSIAVDASGKVHISYYDVTNSDLKYATNTSGSWTTETVDNNGGAGRLALDKSGKVHISYLGNYQLMYATNSSGSWVTETVNSDEDEVYYFMSMAVDRRGTVHISYLNDYSQIMYVTNASGSWKSTIAVEVTGEHKSIEDTGPIALSKSGKAHICYCYYYYENYYDYGDQEYYSRYVGRLMYATNKSGKWVTKTIDDEGVDTWTGSAVYSPSIAFDKSGKVHIAYDKFRNVNSLGGHGIKYATNKSGKWVKTKIDGTSTESRIDYTSLALDSLGKVHICYYDGLNGAIKYVTNAL